LVAERIAGDEEIAKYKQEIAKYREEIEDLNEFKIQKAFPKPITIIAYKLLKVDMENELEELKQSRELERKKYKVNIIIIIQVDPFKI
jgi:hypothetical protein